MRDIVLDMDKACDLYEATKRKETKLPLHLLDCTTGLFVINKENAIYAEQQRIPFINTFEACIQIIELYLKQPQLQKYRDDFMKTVQGKSNKITSFLWYFDSIDGAYSFGKFEAKKIVEIIKNWCKKNGIAYSEPVVYADYSYNWLNN